MKKLLAIATLSLALAVPTMSFASDYMGLYTKPPVKSEVRNDIEGGNVERDFISFYISPKGTSIKPSFRADQEKEDRDSYIVFGVQVPVETRS